MATIQYQTLTRDELRDQLDALTRSVLGMSADEFLDEYRAELAHGSKSGDRLSSKM
jgi:hypothetical protein